MRKRFHKGLGGFIRQKRLTPSSTEVYDVIAVNKKTGVIKVIDKVQTVEEAKQSIRGKEMEGFKFYLLENNTVLKEVV